MEYNIRIEYDEPGTAEAGDRLMAAFEHVHPAPGRSPLGRADVWITMQGEDVGQMAVLAYQHARLYPRRIVAIEVMATEDFDRINGNIPVPELVNAEEAAEILGMSAAAVGQKFASGELPGQRVGKRTIVFARRDIVAAKAKRKPTASEFIAEMLEKDGGKSIYDPSLGEKPITRL